MVYKVGFLEKIFGEKFPKVVTEYYESGQKKAEGTVIGKNPRDIYTKNGIWTWWHKNGQKEKKITLKDGKEDGKWTEWYENGQKWYEATLKDGELIKETYWDEDGNVGLPEESPAE